MYIVCSELDREITKLRVEATASRELQSNSFMAGVEGLLRDLQQKASENEDAMVATVHGHVAATSTQVGVAI